MAGYLSKLRTIHQKELNLLCVSLKLNSKKHQNKPQKKNEREKKWSREKAGHFWLEPSLLQSQKRSSGPQGTFHSLLRVPPALAKALVQPRSGKSLVIFFRVQRPKDMTQETGNGYVLEKSSCVEVDESVS